MLILQLVTMKLRTDDPETLRRSFDAEHPPNPGRLYACKLPALLPLYFDATSLAT
jgi:hypothetical protein